jgi:hypothetical protein
MIALAVQQGSADLLRSPTLAIVSMPAASYDQKLLRDIT